jgi:hypothetical protein
MATLLIGSILLGAVLGRFFKVLVLVPVCALVLAAVFVKSAGVEHGLVHPLFEFAVLITSLQIGYVSGLLSLSPTLLKAALVLAFALLYRSTTHSA